MIQHEIELEHHIEPVEFLQIFPGNKFVIEVVIDDRKASIQITVENGRQDIEQGKDILEFRPFEHMHDIGEIPSNTVGVGIEHDPLRHTISYRYGIVVHTNPLPSPGACRTRVIMASRRESKHSGVSISRCRAVPCKETSGNNESLSRQFSR